VELWLWADWARTHGWPLIGGRAALSAQSLLQRHYLYTQQSGVSRVLRFCRSPPIPSSLNSGLAVRSAEALVGAA